ncbi:MAG TPA: hypothetical protein VGP72_30190 [Planctomycetota bacterium]|jgi:hypothetical protein
MLTTVKGVYKAGKVELLEPAPNVESAQVMVTFMEPEQKQPEKPKGKMMTFGMFPGLQAITDEDFKSAEFNETKALEKWERANRGN